MTVRGKLPPSGWWLVTVLLVLFAAVAIPLVVATVRGNGPPIAFLVFWSFAFAWNGYWWGLRTAVEVGVEGAVLRWRTALLTREAPTSAIRAVRRSRWSAQLAFIEMDGRRPLLVPVRYGFGQLVQSIAAAAPQARVEQP